MNTYIGAEMEITELSLGDSIFPSGWCLVDPVEGKTEGGDVIDCPDDEDLCWGESW